MYAEGQRAAMVDCAQASDEQLLFVVNDHLGAPQLLMNMHEEVVWQMNATPFGELAAANDGVQQPLRFPGQYADGETGYSYNYFRDYDPSLGRYIQSDPIGLMGGVNTFGYALGRPTGLIDEFGLSSACGQQGIVTSEELGQAEFSVREDTLNGIITYPKVENATGKIVASLTLDQGVTLASDGFRDDLLSLSEYASGRQVRVIIGYRSQSRQNQLRASGNTRAAKMSQHTVGFAADIYINGLKKLKLGPRLITQGYSIV